MTACTARPPAYRWSGWGPSYPHVYDLSPCSREVGHMCRIIVCLAPWLVNAWVAFACW